jgi:hypothetical protein
VAQTLMSAASALLPTLAGGLAGGCSGSAAAE